MTRPNLSETSESGLPDASAVSEFPLGIRTPDARTDRGSVRMTEKA